ncbi:MAG: hypothetical protein L6461_16505 [Anaerolineae bacterium]|nr:hypothetical protein [Anaerolineae bacterium]
MLTCPDRSFDTFLLGLSLPQIMSGLIFILLVFDVGLLAYALSQFRRAKLITD